MRYYPIGTVVTLKEGTQPLMIYGRKQINASNSQIWDYVACLYPEGNIDETYNVFFKADDIGEVLFEGWHSPIDEEMQKLLNSGSPH